MNGAKEQIFCNKNNSNSPRFPPLLCCSGEKCRKFELLQKSCTSKSFLYYFPSNITERKIDFITLFRLSFVKRFETNPMIIWSTFGP